MKYRICGDPLVSVVIPTDGRIARTPRGSRDLPLCCIRSIVERTTYKNYELVIVDNGRLSPELLHYLATIRHRRVVYEPTTPFNFASKLNFAAGHAQGEHLLFLNDDTEVISEEWITAMLEFSQQSAIGAVGGKLFYPDGRLQHVGVVLGIGGGACHVFAGQPANSPGRLLPARARAELPDRRHAVRAALSPRRGDVRQPRAHRQPRGSAGAQRAVGAGHRGGPVLQPELDPVVARLPPAARRGVAGR